MKSASLTGFERVAGGRIRAEEAGFVFVPTRRLGPWTYLAVLVSLNVLVWFAGFFDLLPATFAKGIPPLVGVVCVSAMWTFGWRPVSLAWSRMARPTRPLSVRKIEEGGYREQALYAADWGDVAVAPTSHRALFEIEFGYREWRLLVLVIGERAVSLAIAPTSTQWDGMSLVRILVRTLELNPERLCSHVDGAIKRAGLSGSLLFDDSEYGARRQLVDVVCVIGGFLASVAWGVPVLHFVLGHQAAIVAHFGAVWASFALPLILVGPPIALFAASARWIYAAVLSRRAAELVAATSRLKTWGGEVPPFPLGGSSGTVDEARK
jgi:hypothetical protein